MLPTTAWYAPKTALWELFGSLLDGPSTSISDWSGIPLRSVTLGPRTGNPYGRIVAPGPLPLERWLMDTGCGSDLASHADDECGVPQTSLTGVRCQHCQRMRSVAIARQHAHRGVQSDCLGVRATIDAVSPYYWPLLHARDFPSFGVQGSRPTWCDPAGWPSLSGYVEIFRT